ncbi:MAG: hypothetical protein J3K34DRAFT_207874 [Monoraphidium minutum]|nr:MAG: hypothetical protein J3K34DRAFT_207874 [Monoraphidium minutum]
MGSSLTSSNPQHPPRSRYVDTLEAGRRQQSKRQRRTRARPGAPGRGTCGRMASPPRPGAAAGLRRGAARRGDACGGGGPTCTCGRPPADSAGGGPLPPPAPIGAPAPPAAASRPALAPLAWRGLAGACAAHLSWYSFHPPWACRAPGGPAPETHDTMQTAQHSTAHSTALAAGHHSARALDGRPPSMAWQGAADQWLSGAPLLSL